MKATNKLNDCGCVRRACSGGGCNNLLAIASIALAFMLGSARPAAGEEVSATATVWAGLDYSQARLIGKGKFDYGFDDTNRFLPFMFDEWNQLFTQERLADVGSDLRKELLPDLASVNARNAAFNPAQIILQPGADDGLKDTHLTRDLIAAEVQALNLKYTNGLGLVIIVDRLVYGMVKSNEGGNHQTYARSCGGAAYVVFFDVATRRVIAARREYYHVSSGANFRNFWFGPIKDVASTIGDDRFISLAQ
jgi:hypothetical protein